MKTPITFFFILVMNPLTFAQFGEEQNIINEFTTGASFVVSGDMNNDGFEDIVTFSEGYGEMIWSENLQNSGLWKSHFIMNALGGDVVSVHLKDIDGDDILDIVWADRWRNSIFWTKNIGGGNSFGNKQLVTDLLDDLYLIDVADLDGDGDMDIASASNQDDKIAWYQNVDGLGEFSDQKVISTSAKGAQEVHAADMDNDGDLDLLSCSWWDGDIAWYENLDGQGDFTNKLHLVDITGITKIFPIDVDGDGYLDIVAGSYGKDEVYWYRNVEGTGSLEAAVFLIEYKDLYHMRPADLDLDGDLDIIVCSYISYDEVAWFENLDGDWTFSEKKNLLDGHTNNFIVKDIDGNNYPDIVVPLPGLGEVKLIQNNGDIDNSPIVKVEVGIDNVCFISTADLDGDGRKDVLTASNKLFWHRNISDYPLEFEHHQLNVSLSGLFHQVYGKDLDGDGDMDIVYSTLNKIGWFENLDGLGTFNTDQTIGDTKGHFEVVDVDSDGDLDIINGDNDIEWLENLGGAEAFEEHLISTKLGQITFVTIGDFDGDDDVDVVSGAYFPLAEVYWFENTDGFGTWDEGTLISDDATGINYPHTCVAEDFDGDGDVDLVIGGIAFDSFNWLENLDGKGSFGDPIDIDNSVINATSQHAADIDNDGDIDILAANQDGTLFWFENTDGKASFSIGDTLQHSPDGHYPTVHLADFNDDGDLDAFSGFASGSEQTFNIYENLMFHTSTKELTTDIEVLLYPNPTNEFLTIELAKYSEGIVRIIDVTGRHILNNSIQGKVNLPLRNLSSGVYYIFISIEEGNVTKKIVKY